jgi:adenylate cyclase
MGAKLQVQPAKAKPFEVAVGNTATIGRTRENTVCLSASPLVSRQHAVIRCHNGWQYQLIDLGSRNGTYLNDRRVVMPAILENGARIRIADNVLTFVEAADETGGGAETQMQVTLAGTMPAGSVSAQPVAMLVCDIRGFSTMSEKVAPTDLSQLLGVWFRELANMVQAQSGIVDKFIGDALLAYWSLPDGAAAAGAALSVARGILEQAAERQWPGGEPWRVVVALHYGAATFSNVGPSAVRDQTIIGDAVNIVFRLEATSKEVGATVVLSGDFFGQLATPPPVTDFGERELKGKRQLVRVFGLQE